jgi:hypothetical protein
LVGCNDFTMLDNNLNRPVSTQQEHEDDNQNPEDLSKKCLVTEEDVYDALNCRVLGIILNDVVRSVKPFNLFSFF